jgi:hypothetical protein
MMFEPVCRIMMFEPVCRIKMAFDASFAMHIVPRIEGAGGEMAKPT